MPIENLSDIEIADKVIIHFDDFGRTDEDSPFIAAGFNQNDVEEGNHNRTISRIIVLLKDTLKYIEPYNNSSDFYQLTDKGREVKNQGGHFAYLKKVESKSIVDKAKQERKDKADELDLKIKTWQVKTKYVPYLVSIFALGVSIASYFKSEKKPIDLQPMQRQIQQLQNHVKSLDSLLLSDSLLKRRK